MGQPAFDATLEVLKQAKINHRDIRRIVVATSKRSALGGARHPDTTVAAKASIPFIVSMALVRADELAGDPHIVRTLIPSILKDPHIHRLCDLVEVTVDDEIDYNMEKAWPMKFEARVKVTIADGREIVGYRDIWAHTSTMKYEDVAKKFDDIADGILPRENRSAIIDMVADIDQLKNIADLTKLCAVDSAVAIGTLGTH